MVRFYTNKSIHELIYTPFAEMITIKINLRTGPKIYCFDLEDNLEIFSAFFSTKNENQKEKRREIIINEFNIENDDLFNARRYYIIKQALQSMKGYRQSCSFINNQERFELTDFINTFVEDEVVSYFLNSGDKYD